MKCPCGIEHGDCAALEKRGWQDLGRGVFGLFVNCPAPCRLTFFARTVRDAALCASCKRLVTGEAGVDPKMHDLDTDGAPRILCIHCARRSGVGIYLVGLAFRAWVEKGDMTALYQWRLTWGGIRRVPL